MVIGPSEVRAQAKANFVTTIFASLVPAPVQLNWTELAILSLPNTHPTTNTPTRDIIKTAGWEAHIQQAS